MSDHNFTESTRPFIDPCWPRETSDLLPLFGVCPECGKHDVEISACPGLALFGPHAMSDLSPECASKRKSANHSGFMGSRPRYGNSRQLRFIEKWFPGERLTVGIVKMSFLQKLAYTSEIFTKERRIRQLVHVLVRCPQTKFPGRDKCRQDCRFKIMHIVRPS